MATLGEKTSAFARVMQKTGRIISGDQGLKFNIIPNTITLKACTVNQNEIYVNEELIGDFKNENVVSAVGAFYHELSHVIYTDWRFAENLYKNAWNILEDQRIESFFVRRYSPAANYFIAMCYKVFSDADESEVFPFVYGRTYLPKSFRDSAEKNYKNQQNVKGIKNCINEYKALKVVGEVITDAHRGKHNGILSRFSKLIGSDLKGECHSDRNQSYTYSLKGIDSIEEDQSEELDSIEEDQSEELDSIEEDQALESSSEAGDAEKNKEEFNRELSKMFNGVQDSKELSKEISAIESAIKKDEEVLNYGIEKCVMLPASREGLSVRNKCVREFQKISSENEMGWNYRTSSGKLNVRHLMSNNYEDYESAFDSWDEGKNVSAGIEVVFCVDLSSSMYAVDDFELKDGSKNCRERIDISSEAMWVMKSALEQLDTRVTVIGFNDSLVKGLYSPEDSASKSSYKCWTDLVPNTEPYNCTKVASNILKKSKMPNQLLVTITDGYIRPTSSSESISDLIKSISGVKIFLRIDGDGTESSVNKEGTELWEGAHDIVVRVDSVSDVVSAVSEAVKRISTSPQRPFRR